MARAKKITSIEHLDVLAKRLRTRLKRTMNALDKLEKTRARLKKAEAMPLVKTVVFEPDIKPVAPPEAPGFMDLSGAGNNLDAADLGIPAFLQRKKLDPVAEQIKAEQEATKKAKAAGRIAKMKAKKSGETRKMPLTGKAALALINEG